MAVVLEQLREVEVSVLEEARDRNGVERKSFGRPGDRAIRDSVRKRFLTLDREVSIPMNIGGKSL